MFGWFRTLSKKTQWSELDASPNAVDALEAPDSAFNQAPTQMPFEPQPVSADAPLMVPGDAFVASEERTGIDSPSTQNPAAHELATPGTSSPEHEIAPLRVIREAADLATPVVETPALENSALEPELATEEPAANDAVASNDHTDAPSGAHAAADDAVEADDAGLLAAPSTRPSMPLSAHPNFAGLGLAEWAPNTPRLLEPTAALGPDAAQELLALFDDLFGPTGRYRLEWRVDRAKSDDAMFAEIMVADLVRRVQNTLGDLAEQRELEAAPAPRAIEAAPALEATDEYRQAS